MAKKYNARGAARQMDRITIKALLEPDNHFSSLLFLAFGLLRFPLIHSDPYCMFCLF